MRKTRGGEERKEGEVGRMRRKGRGGEKERGQEQSKRVAERHDRVGAKLIDNESKGVEES